MSKQQDEFIWATRKIGKETFNRKFTALAWKLMGSKGTKDNPPRNGWTQVPSELVGKTKDVVVPEATNKASTVNTPVVKEETIDELKARLAKMEAVEEAKNGSNDTTQETVADDTPDAPGTGNQQATKYDGPLSTDNEQGVVAAIAHMKTLKTESELNNYASADTRATVKKALVKLSTDLKDN